MALISIEEETHSELVDQAARSVKWSFLYNLVPRLVTPFSTIILAAVLTPSDFGLVAISTFIIALARIVVDMGLGQAVIQRQTDVEEAASVGLWICLLVSAGLYFLLWIFAPWFSAAYGNEKAVSVIRVAAFSLPLFAASSIPKALLTRRMAFRSLFWVNSSFLILQAFASVLLAILGIGYWALILGQLFGLLISVGLAWKMVRWQPQFILNWPMLRSMWTFSIWIMLSSFQNWLFLYADNAIAGLFLGIQGLGVYSLGFNIAILIPGFLGASLSDVAYPTFCKLQENPRKVGESLVKLQAVTATILFPIAFGFSAIANSAISLLYGEKWPGLGMVLSVLVIMPGLSCIWTLNDNAYRAIGKPGIWTKLAGISLAILLPLLWFAAPYGLVIFTLIRFLGGWILPLENMFFGAPNLSVNLKDQLRPLAFPLLFSLTMYALVSLLIHQLEPMQGIWGWVKLFSIILIGAGTYLLQIWFLRRETWNDLQLSLRRVIS